ncbi:cache domain-containing sensor histidine kinase [Dorea sp. AF36-15AT]|uniref:cache domain-containing sensor histidine kinase n=1 Tax=Dorea sp. AF36-15AT TaxID=2292041 RepID=UPI00267CA95E|nr:sensor histidine kinase [Dorea sp. AF36-15AT]
MKDMKNDSGIRKTFAKFNIQSIILSVLMTLSLVTVTVMGFLLYHRFKLASDKSAVANTEMTVESTIDRLNSSLLDLRQISDAANYNIVQEYDISSQEFTRQFSMLYETNVDKIQSLALYGYDGMLIESEPVATVKDNVKVAEQKWYQDARSEIENIHFSTPHVQNLFDDGTFRYHRVVSLSRSVDINDGSTSGSGVLLVDMKYSVLEDMLERINETSSGIYYYLCSRDGEIIYHPRWTEINRGLFKEKNNKAASYEDGIYEMKTDGQKENIVVGSVAYTGWKLIGVVPESVQETSINKFRYYIITTILILVMMLLQVNRFISRKISRPIRELDESVKAYEAGAMPDIYIGGSAEIRHLGYSVQKSYEQIEALMKEIIQQQTERRKSELDALQSQINPHFLYNTLESITWMIEAQRNKEAVVMISELAKLLRVSLSRGKTIISIGDELQHSRSYMNIQRVRYKERFKVEFLIDEEIKNYCIVKLVIQPLLENAIYYGVGNMDEDDDGQILIRGEKKGEDIYISIEDNGMGMPEDIRSNILTDNSKVPKHGSGVGVINVHSRISLMFGPEYGLEVYSELDEGTKVVIHIPAIPYTKENAEQLEKQTYGQRRMPDEEE